MSTIPTQNPVPSEAASDLKYNSGKFDEFVTSNNHFYTDRFGKKHYTIDGINYLSKQAMLNYGYITKRSFESGNTIINPNDVLLWESNGEYYRWDGELPKAVSAGSTPESAGGVGDGKWKGVGGATLRDELKSPSGSGLVGHNSATVKDELNLINENISNIKDEFVTSTVPPSLPSINDSFKIVSSDENGIYVLTKKSMGRSGFVMMRITNYCVPEDSQNYGGKSPYRFSEVNELSNIIVAKINPLSSKNTSEYKFSRGIMMNAFGLSSDNAGIVYSKKGDLGINDLSTRMVSQNGEVIYKCTNAVVRFISTSGSSNNIEIAVSTDGESYEQVVSYNIQSATTNTNIINIKVNSDKCYKYVKIKNTDSRPAYIVGLNIVTLNDVNDNNSAEFDSIAGEIRKKFGDFDSRYTVGNGALEFAAVDAENKKFFGTYHGGHSEFLERLRTGSKNYNLDTGTVTGFDLTRMVVLHSASIMTIRDTVYNYTAFNQVGDGVIITNYSISLKSGDPIQCSRVFTHMCTTSKAFTWTHLPKTYNKTDLGDTSLGQCGFIQQYRADTTNTLNSYFSQLSVRNNYKNGAYIANTASYNKQYYGPVLKSGNDGVPFFGGNFVTAKEFF